ncbi:UNVERIFIED_CONTAM: hypothetical protein FKN15_076186 [Acipenser sinensis]
MQDSKAVFGITARFTIDSVAEKTDNDHLALKQTGHQHDPWSVPLDELEAFMYYYMPVEHLVPEAWVTVDSCAKCPKTVCGNLNNSLSQRRPEWVASDQKALK